MNEGITKTDLQRDFEVAITQFRACARIAMTYQKALREIERSGGPAGDLAAKALQTGSNPSPQPNTTKTENE